MTKKIPVDIFLKNLSEKELSQNEKLRLVEWLSEDSSNLDVYYDARTMSGSQDARDKIMHPDKKKAWKKIELKAGLKNKRSLNFIIRSAVAVALILLGVGLNYFVESEMNEEYFSCVYAPPGQKCEIFLPDSTHVWLDAGSSLKYSNLYGKNSRGIFVDGEAYFDVKHNQDKPFLVSVHDLTVKVHGTSFNVRGYKNETKIEVALNSGKVSVLKEDEVLTSLTPGEILQYDKNSCEFSKRNDDVNVISAWKENTLVFDQMPVHDMIRYLEKWYGVNILVENENVHQHLYTFNLKTESLRELLELIKVMTPMQYRIEGENVFIKYSY